MADEAVVRIGAAFDKSNVDAGVADVTELVNKANQSMSTVVEETSARTKSAWLNMSEGVKSSAASISADSLKVAETSKMVVAAQADVRRAWVLAKDASIPAAESMGYLAAAQQRLAAAQFEAAAATKTAAAEMTASAEAPAAAWGAAGLKIRAALTGVQEKMVETAGTSKLSAEGIAGGFAGLGGMLGGLLGAGIAVGFVGHYMDDTTKSIVEMGHAAEETGLSFERLVGLRQLMKEMGMDWDTLARSIFHMNAVQYEALNGSEKMKQAFLDLGVSQEQLKDSTPEQMLQLVAVGMQKYAGTIREANAVREIFGRGGLKLLPILEKEGENLLKDADAAQKKTGVDKEALEVSQRWTKAMAEFSAHIQSVMIPVLEHLWDVVDGLIGVFQVSTSFITDSVKEIGAAFIAAYSPVAMFGTLMKDVLTLNWSGVKSDVEIMAKDIALSFKNSFQEIQGESDKMWDHFHFQGQSAMEDMKLPHGGKQDETGEPDAGGKSGTQGSGPELMTGAFNKSIRDQGQSKGLAETVWDQFVAKQQLAAISTFMKDYGKMEADAEKKAVEAQRRGAEEKMRIGLKDLEDFEQQCRFKVRMGEMSERQMLAAVEAAAKKEEQIRRQQMAVIESIDKGNEKKFAEDLKKEEEETREFAKRITQIHQQAALAFKTNWDKATNQFNAAFTTAFNQIITRSKSVSQAFAQMFNTIIMQVADMVVKWLLKEAEKWAMIHVMTAMGMTTQKAIQGPANAGAAASNAAVAATGAASAVASVPIVGPALAAAAASSMTAMMAPFIATAALADSGGLIPHKGMMVNLSGAAERTLDPRQTAQFEKMVSQSSSSSSSSTTHNHITQNLNGYDRAGLKSALRDHAGDILDIVRSGYRGGLLTA